MTRAGAALAVGMLAVGCSGGDIRGKFSAELYGAPVKFASAFLVSHGGRSFRMYASTDRRGCSWAERGATGFFGSTEIYLAFDGAPALGDDGRFAWRATGIHWAGNHHDTVTTSLKWAEPIEVTATKGCGKHLRMAFDVKPDMTGGGHAAGRVDIDADLVCCEAASAKEGPLRLRLAGETLTFAKAGETRTKSGETRFRLTRLNDPCHNEVTHEDAIIDLRADAGGKVTSVHVSGLLFPDFGLDTPLGGGGPMPQLVRDGKKARFTGATELRPFGVFDRKKVQHAELDGELSISTCPDE